MEARDALRCNKIAIIVVALILGVGLVDAEWWTDPSDPGGSVTYTKRIGTGASNENPHS